MCLIAAIIIIELFVAAHNIDMHIQIPVYFQHYVYVQH